MKEQSKPSMVQAGLGSDVRAEVLIEESLCGSSGAERASGPFEVHKEHRVPQAELNIPLVQLRFHLLIGATLGHQPGTIVREH